MDCRNFLAFSALVGLSLPYISPKKAKACQDKWSKIGAISVRRIIKEHDLPEVKGLSAADENGYIDYAEFIKLRKVELVDEFEEEYLKKLQLDGSSLDDFLTREADSCINEDDGVHHEYYVFESDVKSGIIKFRELAIRSVGRNYTANWRVKFYSYLLNCDINLKMYKPEEYCPPSKLTVEEYAVKAITKQHKQAKKVLQEIVNYYNLKELPRGN